MSTTPFKRVEWVWESHLVTRLGINRDELRALRTKLLVPGLDWQSKKNRVEISKSGLEKLEAHLKTGSAPHAPVQTDGQAEATAGESPEKNAAPGGARGLAALIPPELTRIAVRRVFPKNRHIIEGYFEGTDPAQQKNVVRVKVRDSSKYTRFDPNGKPLALECRHIQADFYEHAGPVPRRKGRL
jgi:hypothetical protein